MTNNLVLAFKFTYIFIDIYSLKSNTFQKYTELSTTYNFVVVNITYKLSERDPKLARSFDRY